MSLGEQVIRLLPSALTGRIARIPFARRLMRSAFWTLVGAIAARILRIPISMLLARWMGPAQYGELGMASTSIDLFGVFAGLGLGLTTTKYIAELRSTNPERTGKIIAVSTVVAAVGGAVIAAVMFMLAPWLATHTLSNPRLIVPLRIGTLALFFSSLNGAQSGALYGFEAYRVTAKLQAAVGVLDVFFMLGGFRLGGLNGVLLGVSASRFTNYLMLHFALKREASRHNVPLNVKHWRDELPVVWHFSLPAAVGAIMVIPVNWICSAILVNRPDGYLEMGSYNVTNQWYNMLIFLPTMLGSGLLPVLSDRIGNRDTTSAGKILKMMLQLNAIIVIPVATMMTLFSSHIMGLYGAGYRDAWATLSAAVWTAAIMALIAPVGDVIAASGKMWIGLLMNAAWALVYIPFTYLLVHWGALGLASSRLIAYSAHAVWSLAFAYFIIRRKSSEEQSPEQALLPQIQELA